jgi:hypothetical protein
VGLFTDISRGGKAKKKPTKMRDPENQQGKDRSE